MTDPKWQVYLRVSEQAMSERLTELVGKPVTVKLGSAGEELSTADVHVDGREPTAEEDVIILGWFKSWDEEAFHSNMTMLAPEGPAS